MKSLFEYGGESIIVANFGTVAPSRFWWEYRRQGYSIKSSSACIDLSLEILMNENKPVMVDKVEVEHGNAQKKTAASGNLALSAFRWHDETEWFFNWIRPFNCEIFRWYFDGINHTSSYGELLVWSSKCFSETRKYWLFGTTRILMYRTKSIVLTYESNGLHKMKTFEWELGRINWASGYGEIFPS